MTKYITVNCNQFWKCSRYGLWAFATGIFLLGIIAQVSTLETYTSGTNSEGAYNGSSCMVGFFSGEKFCSKYGEANYSWSYETRENVNSYLIFHIVLLIAIQVLVLFIYNLEREWIKLRCK